MKGGPEEADMGSGECERRDIHYSLKEFLCDGVKLVPKGNF